MVNERDHHLLPIVTPVGLLWWLRMLICSSVHTMNTLPTVYYISLMLHELGEQSEQFCKNPCFGRPFLPSPAGEGLQRVYEAQGETERASSLKFSKRLRRVHPVPEGLPPCSLPRGGLTSDGGQWAGQWGDPHSTLKWRAARGTFWKYWELWSRRGFLVSARLTKAGFRERLSWPLRNSKGDDRSKCQLGRG